MCSGIERNLDSNGRCLRVRKRTLSIMQACRHRGSGQYQVQKNKNKRGCKTVNNKTLHFRSM